MHDISMKSSFQIIWSDDLFLVQHVAVVEEVVEQGSPDIYRLTVLSIAETVESSCE